MKVPSLVVVLSVLALGCTDDGGADGGTSYCETCNLDEQIPIVAASDATDCGEAPLNGDASAAIACVEQALADGTPFFVQQELQGIDSAVVLAWVVDDDGVVQRLSYDSNICGGAGGCNDDCGPRVSMAQCGNARIGADPEQSIVDCDVGSFSALCEPPI